MGLFMRRVSAGRLGAKFMVYAAGRTISTLGDNIHQVALMLLAFRMTGSAGDVAKVLLAYSIPSVLLAPFAGVIIDRLPRRESLIGLDLIRAVLVMLIPFSPSIGYVIGISVIHASLRRFANPLNMAYLTELLDRDQLLAGNATLSAASSVSQIVGPALGGLLVALVSPVTAFAVDSVSFLVSAACMLGLPKSQTTGHRGKPNFLAEFQSGFAAYADIPNLRGLVLFMAGVMFCSGLVNPNLVVHAKSTLGLGEQQYGMMMSALGIGATMGASFSALLGARVSAGAKLTAGAALDGLAVLAIAASRSSLQATVALGLEGVASSLVLVNSDVALQTLTPTDLRGRVFTIFRGIVSLAIIVAQFSVGALTVRFGTRMVLSVAGLFLVLISAGSLRQVRSLFEVMPGLLKAPLPLESPRAQSDAGPDRGE